MWQYEKKLQYPVNIKTPNAKLAKVIITQLGGLSSKKIYKAFPSGVSTTTIITYFAVDIVIFLLHSPKFDKKHQNFVKSDLIQALYNGDICKDRADVFNTNRM